MTEILGFLRSRMFEIVTILGALTLCFKQPKRKNGWIWFALAVAADLAFNVLWADWMRSHPGGMAYNLVRYFGQFFFVLGIVYVWLDCRLLTAVFVATTAYSMQQLAGRLSGALGILLAPEGRSKLVDFLLLLLCVLAVFIVTLLLFRRRNRGYSRVIQIANPAQLIITTLALAVMIVIEEIDLPMIRSVTDRTINLANYLSSAIFALMIIILEFNVLQRHDLEEELAVTRRILEEERKQYEREKEVVEVINIKCHDLRHQLQAVGQSIPEHEKEQIQEAVRQYDTRVKTGNRALDVVLTMKRMICEGSDIEFSCLVNGALLNFMEESDIYSLFGNLLDNAIEEARHFDSEHRVISLSVAQEQQFVLIHEENFIQAVPQMVDGIPQTTKADKENHGFGVRSMRLIAEKYNGHFMIHVDKSLFRLDIMLPIPPAEGWRISRNPGGCALLRRSFLLRKMMLRVTKGRFQP